MLLSVFTSRLEVARGVEGADLMRALVAEKEGDGEDEDMTVPYKSS